MIKRLTLADVKRGVNADTVNPEVERTVREIIAKVREEGDAALIELTKKFDGNINSLRVTEEEISAAVARCDEYFLETLRQAKTNIARYHSEQKRKGYEIKDGAVVLGQKVTPLKRVGLYVPGGTASYPSTVLMDSVPAVIAGVEEIVMVTPPDRDGNISDVILAAASIAGVTSIFKVGGAQAVAALAYGTESIPRVDKIVGPGNIFVATAKRMVYGTVDIDMIAGPSEILIIADGTAVPRYVAADMLSQAEHDRNASATLITDSPELADRVTEELYKQLNLLPRREIATASIENNGKIIVTEDLEQAVVAANLLAPEHLELSVEDPFKYLDKVVNAGSVFLGSYSPEPLGDYFAGTNHTLPTSGTARFSSPLSVDDFVKKSSYIYYDRESLAGVSDRIIDFAEREGLSAHANALRVRFEGEE